LNPPPLYSAAFKKHRNYLCAALNESLENSIFVVERLKPPPRSKEVAYLTQYFVDGLSRLQDLINAVLLPEGVNLHIKGAFCHLNQPYGAVVDFEPPGTPRGCELADLLFLATYDSPHGKADFGNGVFLQAKLTDVVGSPNSSTSRQRALYLSAKEFTYRNPERYTDPLVGDNTPLGRRYMPSAKSSGFCFWTFNPKKASSAGIPWAWHASEIFDPGALIDPTLARPFADAIVSLFEGKFGESIGPFVKGKYDWNRIAHDIFNRALKEVVGSGTGVAEADTIRRAIVGDPPRLTGLLNSGLMIKRNPFEMLALGLSNPWSNELLSKLASSKEIGGETLEKLLSKKAGDPPPPSGNATQDDGGGGPSVVVFEFSSRAES
jgi:hypothetical protein